MNKTGIRNSRTASPVKAFTLIEVLLVVTVLGIVTMFALPVYRDYLVQGCRTDAMVALEEIANEQAQYYFDHNQYASAIALLPVSMTSPQEHYTLSTNRISGDTNTYQITAVQSGGSDCLPANDYQYRVNHTGTRERKASGGAWTAGWE